MTWSKPHAQTSDSDFVTRLPVQPSCSDLWSKDDVLLLHASHPMSSHNRNNNYYLLLTLFVCLFVRSFLCTCLRFDYTLWGASGPRCNSPSDKSRTHIQLFIKTLRPSRWINLELRLDLQLLAFVTELSSRQLLCSHPYLSSSMVDRWSWCWRPKGQAKSRPASRLPYDFTCGPSQWLFFVEREKLPLAPPPPKGTALVCK